MPALTRVVMNHILEFSVAQVPVKNLSRPAILSGRTSPEHPSKRTKLSLPARGRWKHRSRRSSRSSDQEGRRGRSRRKRSPCPRPFRYRKLQSLPQPRQKLPSGCGRDDSCRSKLRKDLPNRHCRSRLRTLPGPSRSRSGQGFGGDVRKCAVVIIGDKMIIDRAEPESAGVVPSAPGEVRPPSLNHRSRDFPVPVVSMMYYFVFLPPNTVVMVSPAFSAMSVKLAMGAVCGA